MLHRSLSCCCSPSVWQDNPWCSRAARSEPAPAASLRRRLEIPPSPGSLLNAASEYMFSSFFSSFPFFFFSSLKDLQRNKQAEAKHLMDIFFTGSFINSV